MSAHATLTAIEQEAEAFCRRRFTDAASYLGEKDAFCKRVRALVRKGRREIGVPEMLSFGTGRRTFAGRSFSVELRMPRARKAG
ncbi:hypothetical protein [Methylorubrum extorquens]